MAVWQGTCGSNKLPCHVSEWVNMGGARRQTSLFAQMIWRKHSVRRDFLFGETSTCRKHDAVLFI